MQADLAKPPIQPHQSAGRLDWSKPPRFFLSCAEVSGEVHGANLARALRHLAHEAGLSEPELVGFGGPDLAAAGVQIVADPVQGATLHAGSILKALPFYRGLIRQAAECFQGSPDQPPVDLFVPVDSPALHVPMARVARRYDVPTWHFIAPQFWGWAPWRAGRYRRNVAHAFTILPFEPYWYERHRIPVTHVGHPLLDALAELPAPPAPNDPVRSDWVLLPGSRRGEITDNLEWMLRAMAPLLERHPELVVHIAQSRADHQALIESIIDQVTWARGTRRPEVSIGSLHDVLARCRSALAVSGTVLTDLLVHRIPAVVIYRDPGGWKGKMVNRLLTPGMFASTNLVAGYELLPEFCFGDDGPLQQVGADLVRMQEDLAWRNELLAGLEEVARRLGGPGACERAARALLEAYSASQTRPHRAAHKAAPRAAPQG